MNISYNWLRNYINTQLSAEEVAAKLTSIGLEVDDLRFYSNMPPGLDNLIIGHVQLVEQHPNADRLKITRVDIGSENLLNIVCGAANVAEGQKVVIAPIGCTISPKNAEPFKIQKSKIRGEVSEGMICAEDEIGLGNSHDGIIVLPEDAQIGKNLADYMQVYKDFTIEIGLTPNRVDAASHIGVARDLAAATASKVQYPEKLSLSSYEGKSPIEVEIQDVEGCPRYSGLTIKNIKIQPSPLWLQNYLKAVNLSPINNIVDATNFVMYELGQPLHAFDAERIAGNKIIVAKAKAGEEIVTLDGKTRALNQEELTIRNINGPVAIAGVFGGKDSGISESTTSIFIESAYFNPSSIRKSSKVHGLHTDASFRYERGTDPNLTLDALARVAKIIIDIAGGEVQGGVIDEYPQPILPKVIEFSYEFLNRTAGAQIPENEVDTILKGLEIEIIEKSENVLKLKIPTYKVDVTRPIDVVEEILRIYSYDKIAISHNVKNVIQVDKFDKREKLRKKAAAFLSAQGFYEIYLLSMVGNELNFPSEEKAPELLNPLSQDLGVMRNNLLLSALRSISYNLNRQQKNIRFYKSGNIFFKEGNNYRQELKMGIWLTGDAVAQNWAQQGRSADFYYLKGITDAILNLSGVGELKPENLEVAHFQQAAVFKHRNGTEVLQIGKVHPIVLKKFDINQAVFYAEFNWQWVEDQLQFADKKFTAISKFPRVERDLALILPVELRYIDVKERISKAGKPLLKSTEIFDVYQGEQIEKGKKSYAVRLIFEDVNQTLEDKRIEEVMQKIMGTLKKELGIEIRS